MNSSGEKKKRHAGLKVLIVIAVLVFLFLCLIGFITDFLWFKELDYVSVFLTKLLTQLKIGIPTFIVVTFLAYVYLKFLKRGYFKKVVSDEVTDHRRLNIISWSLAGIYGAITTFFAVKKLWFLLLQFVNSTGFDKKDPLYSIDISFYVFKLDFIEEANQLLIVLLIAFALLTVIYYSVLLSVRTPQIFERVSDDAKEDSGASEENAQSSGYGGGTAGGQFGGFDNINDIFGKFAKSFQNGGKSPFQKTAKPKKQFDHSNLKLLISIAEKQLIIVGVLFFLMVGVNFFLKQYDLLFGQYRCRIRRGLYRCNGDSRGFTGSSCGLCRSGGDRIRCWYVAQKNSNRACYTAPIAIADCTGAVGVGGADWLVQNLVVTPDEINKESKYLETQYRISRSTAYRLERM